MPDPPDERSVDSPPPTPALSDAERSVAAAEAVHQVAATLDAARARDRSLLDPGERILPARRSYRYPQPRSGELRRSGIAGSIS